MGRKRTPVAGESGGVDGTTATTANNSPGDLKTLIHEHSLFFDQLVELIPARFFLPYSGDDKPWFPGLSMSEKKKFKAQTRENIIKSRRDRLDPTQPSSTLDLLKQSLTEEKESSDEEPEEDDDDNDDDDGEDDGDDEEEEEEEQEEQEVGEAGKAQNKVTLAGEQPVTYEELQERLRRRIAELAAGRNTRPESRLKQERKKEMKNKKKLKVETKKNREKNKDKDVASTSNSGKRKREDEILSKNKKKNKIGEPTDITFGQVRIDGKDNKKRKKKLPKEKELERAKRLEEVKKDPEKGKKVSWKAAVSKAAGEKVHDDPKLLKQSIKRDKKKQQKNAQKWKERELTVAKAKAEKQSKRTENIKGRIHEKKMRKIEKREKKLMRPGFEGRKEGYMNE